MKLDFNAGIGENTVISLMFREPQVNLYVRSVEESVRFYAGFGFVETFRTPKDGAPIHVEMRLGWLVFGLADISSVEQIHGFRVGGGGARAEIVLWTDDVDAAFSKLVDAGASVLSAPHDFIGTVRAAWIADPDGNPVQIVMHRAG